MFRWSRIFIFCIIEFIRASTQLQDILGASGEVRRFLTSPTREGSSTFSDRNLFSVISNLYRSVLLSQNSGSTFAREAIRDAFLIASQIAGNGHFHT